MIVTGWHFINTGLQPGEEVEMRAQPFQRLKSTAGKPLKRLYRNRGGLHRAEARC